MKFKSNAKYGMPLESGSIFEGKIGKLLISVHHIYNGREWYLSCRNLNITQKPLKSEKLIDAITETKEILKNAVDSLQQDVNDFLQESIEISRY